MTEQLWVTKPKIKKILEELGDDMAMFIPIYKDDDMNSWKIRGK